MYLKKKIVALIPARAGSKRLPNKNILPLNGQPLISHTIKSARASKFIDRVIVSTDSPVIAQVCRKFGAEVPFLRPEEIAGDKTSDYPVISHALNWLEKEENYFADIIVWLRPTVPLREKDLIDRCIETVVKTKADSVRSVRNVGRFHPYWMLKVKKNGLAQSFLRGKTIDKYYQHQLLPELFEHDGYCDVTLSKNINRRCAPTQTLKGMYGKKMAVVINDDGRPVVNIDTREDFQLAEILMNRK